MLNSRCQRVLPCLVILVVIVILFADNQPWKKLKLHQGVIKYYAEKNLITNSSNSTENIRQNAIQGLLVSSVSQNQILSETPNNEKTSDGTTTKAIAVPKDGCNASNQIKQFVLTKTEQTGSSTLFAMLARFACKNNLIPVLPGLKEYHIHWYEKKGKDGGYYIFPETAEKADILINHAPYNKSALERNMKPGYKYISIVREPVSRFLSAIHYFSNVRQVKDLFQKYLILSRQRAENILQHDDLMYLYRGNDSSFFHLSQLRWHGFNYSLRDNMTAIREYIQWLKPQIDIIVLNDQYDASLMIMRKRFCWSYLDMFYKMYEVTHAGKRLLSAKARAKLLSPELNLGDQLLYDELNRTWWQQTEVADDEFWKEVGYFTKINRQVSRDWCLRVNATQKPYSIPPSQWHDSLKLSIKLCNFISVGDKGKLMDGLREGNCY